MESAVAFFLHCTRSHSSFSFFVWLSPKSIQISEKESDEVIGWQRGVFLGHGKGVGRVKRERGWLGKERSPPASLPVGSRGHLNANRLLTVEVG